MFMAPAAAPRGSSRLTDRCRGCGGCRSPPRGGKLCEINGENKSIPHRESGLTLARMTSIVVVICKPESWACIHAAHFGGARAAASQDARRADSCFCEHALACFALTSTARARVEHNILC